MNGEDLFCDWDFNIVEGGGLNKNGPSRNRNVRLSLKTVENVADLIAAMVAARGCAGSVGFTLMEAVASKSILQETETQGFP